MNRIYTKKPLTHSQRERMIMLARRLHRFSISFMVTALGLDLSTHTSDMVVYELVTSGLYLPDGKIPFMWKLIKTPPKEQ